MVVVICTWFALMWVCGSGVADEDADADVDVSFCGALTQPAINNTARIAATKTTKSVRFIFLPP